MKYLNFEWIGKTNNFKFDNEEFVFVCVINPIAHHFVPNIGWVLLNPKAPKTYSHFKLRVLPAFHKITYPVKDSSFPSWMRMDTNSTPNISSTDKCIICISYKPGYHSVQPRINFNIIYKDNVDNIIRTTQKTKTSWGLNNHEFYIGDGTNVDIYEISMLKNISYDSDVNTIIEYYKNKYLFT